MINILFDMFTIVYEEYYNCATEQMFEKCNIYLNDLLLSSVMHLTREDICGSKHECDICIILFTM